MGFNTRYCPLGKSFASPTDVLLCTDIYANVVCVCAINRAQPIRQLISDLPPSRISAYKKTFFHSSLDYFGPFIFMEGRSQRKARGLWFTCMSSRAVHVKLVTSLSLSKFVFFFNTVDLVVYVGL